jgi:hypothetical protein
VTFIDWDHLARFWNVTVDRAHALAHALPSVSIFEDGELTVTFQNWSKYQQDSTGAARMRALRAKKRREEKRVTTPPPTSPAATMPTGRPDDLSITRPGTDWPDRSEGEGLTPTRQVIQTTLARLQAQVDRDHPELRELGE